MQTKIIAVRDLVWIDEERSGIDMTIELDGVGEIPFTARPDDIEPHGRQLFADAVAGEFGPIAEG